MSVPRSAVLVSSIGPSQILILPSTYPGLVRLLSSIEGVPGSAMAVLYTTDDTWSLVTEGNYQQITQISTPTPLKIMIKQRESPNWTLTYVLSFVTTNCIQVYDIDSGRRSYLRSPILHWSGRVCMCASHRFFFSGGYENPRGAFELDLLKGVERELPSMLRGRIWHAVCCHEDALYAVGGRESRGGEAKDTAEVLLAGLWVSLPEMVFQRESHSLVGHATAIYAFGGFDGEKRLSSIEKYEGTWTLLQWQMPEPRQMVGVCFTSNDTVVLAGGQDDGTEKTEVWELELQTGRILALPPLPKPEYFSGRQLVLRNFVEMYALGHFPGVLNLTARQWVEMAY